MGAHTAVIAMLKREVAIAVFPTVFVFEVIAGIVQNQVIDKITFVVVLVRMVVVMCEQLRQLDKLFCKRIICQKLQQQEYGCELFHRSNIGNFTKRKCKDP